MQCIVLSQGVSHTQWHSCTESLPRPTGGTGSLGGNNFAVPPTNPVPTFWPEHVPPTEFCPWKFPSIFFSIFDYFLAQNCIRKLYFMLKNTKICSNFAVGTFWPQHTIFPSPPSSDSVLDAIPPSDSVPDGDRKSSPKASPPPKILLKNPGIENFAWRFVE